MWPAIGHLWFKLPKYVSVVNKYTLRAKGVEAADICFTFCTCVAVSNRPVLWNKTLQPLIPLRWFCYLLYLHYSCTCSIKLLMLIWHTASIKIYKVQHNSAILKANQLKKKKANVRMYVIFLIWNANLTTRLMINILLFSLD